MIKETLCETFYSTQLEIVQNTVIKLILYLPVNDCLFESDWTVGTQNLHCKVHYEQDSTFQSFKVIKVFRDNSSDKEKENQS